jgi:hypothetical protein
MENPRLKQYNSKVHAINHITYNKFKISNIISAYSQNVVSFTLSLYKNVNSLGVFYLSQTSSIAILYNSGLYDLRIS